MRGVVADIWDVLSRGWKLVIGGGLLAALGFAQESLGLIYDSKEGFQWPSWYWFLLPIASYLLAAHLVLKQRRTELNAMRQEVEELRKRKGPTFLEMAEGAQLHQSQISDNVMTVGQAEQKILPPSLSDADYCARLKKLLADLEDFFLERARAEPAELRSFSGTWPRYHNETKALYKKNFGAEVAFLIEEGISRGEIEPMNRSLAIKPVNSYSLDELKNLLGVVLRRLEGRSQT